jgi:hypothetical protein
MKALSSKKIPDITSVPTRVSLADTECPNSDFGRSDNMFFEYDARTVHKDAPPPRDR